MVMNSYRKKHQLKNSFGKTTTDEAAFSKNIELFNSIFDGGTLGPYLGGLDPRNGNSKPGYISRGCLMNPSYLTYEWRVDTLGRKIPYAGCGDEIYKINNLHIHSKKMEPFLSCPK